jgi:amino acid transporter
VAGFTVGWLVWVVRLTSFAANCNLLPDYLGLFFPAASHGLPRALIIIGVVTALAAANVRGVRIVADASNAMAIGKLVPLGIFAIAGLFFIDPARFSFAVVPGYHSFSQAVLLLVYAFTGFEMAVIPAGEVRQPGRDQPAALMMGMAVVVTVYILIQAVCIGTLPGLAGSQRPLADAAGHFLGPWGAVLMTVGIVVSLGGNLNVLILTASRTIFAIAQRGELPKPLAAVHPRFHTPAAAVILTTALMLVLTLSGTFVYLITLSTIARLVTYLATCSALPLLRRRPSAPAATFRMPGGVFVAVAGVVLCLWLLSNSTLREARDTGIAVAIGLSLYWLNRRHGAGLGAGKVGVRADLP